MIITTLKDTLADNWSVITIFLVTMITLRIFYFHNHRQKVSLYREFFNILAIVYVFLLFQLLTKVELNSGSGVNIIPFKEIMRYELGSRLFIFNVLGNIAVFIPFGFFVADYVKAKNISPVLIISTIVSATVEFVQLEIGRSFDIDDIILNVIGGILGYLLYVALKSIKSHLPNVFQKDGIYNLICAIIIVLFIVYLLNSIGVIAIP